jgi:hypothetical protein
MFLRTPDVWPWTFEQTRKDYAFDTKEGLIKKGTKRSIKSIDRIACNEEIKGPNLGRVL